MAWGGLGVWASHPLGLGEKSMARGTFNPFGSFESGSWFILEMVLIEIAAGLDILREGSLAIEAHTGSEKSSVGFGGHQPLRIGM